MEKADLDKAKQLVIEIQDRLDSITKLNPNITLGFEENEIPLCSGAIIRRYLITAYFTKVIRN